MSKSWMASWAVLAIALVALGAGQAAYGAFSINIIAKPGMAGNQPALDAFGRAAAQWADHISDDITIDIDAGMASLEILGPLSQALSSNFIATEPNEFQYCMKLDAEDESDDGIVAFLPDMKDFTALLPSGFEIKEHALGHKQLSATKANLKALGFSAAELDAHDGGISDGVITFNTDSSWDYDNRDGVDLLKFDFESAAAHEIGHILGFISIVDQIDLLVSLDETAIVYPTTLDVFRFENGGVNDPETTAKFKTSPRCLVPGTECNFDQIESARDSNGEIPMSTGVHAEDGDGRQASHWKDNTVTFGAVSAMMDPVIVSGQSFAVTDSDLRALDLIGYDIVVPEPASMAMVCIGGLAMLRRRRTR